MSIVERYCPQEIEAKWQKHWETACSCHTEMDETKPKCFRIRRENSTWGMSATTPSAT